MAVGRPERSGRSTKAKSVDRGDVHVRAAAVCRFVRGGVRGVILGCCQVLLAFAEEPLSHCPAAGVRDVGDVFSRLRRWHRRLRAGAASSPACRSGYAVTIRYIEGLLIIPIAAAPVSMVRYDCLLFDASWRPYCTWLAIAIAGAPF